MKTFTRTAIVAVAGTFALGTVGWAAAASADEPAAKRENTSAVITQDVDLDDADDLDDAAAARVGLDDPTNNTAQTRNTAPTKNTVKTVNTAPTKNTAPTVTNNTAPTKNTVKTVNTAPTKNTAPTVTNATR